MSNATYTKEKITKMVDEACLAIADRADLGEDGVIDALNLLANAVVWQLDNPRKKLNLSKVVADCYHDSDLDEVIGWFA
ncbi:hypothetical protein BH762_gp040 [Gordonia phage OneUp]|uniref:Uncharacterized protein n=1 Tax=Gordonia phage OneUp TaxID=1838074 RepID=A0A160DF05_9CAUD|nr:hypothetical protein BH762_gp040 [Gordonia phage OneUp]ANA86478.1 hypothetical protein PBI_ONEUP_145 [Gordonia phage OneUp]